VDKTVALAIFCYILIFCLAFSFPGFAVWTIWNCGGISAAVKDLAHSVAGSDWNCVLRQECAILQRNGHVCGTAIIQDNDGLWAKSFCVLLFCLIMVCVYNCCISTHVKWVFRQKCENLGMRVRGARSHSVFLLLAQQWMIWCFLRDGRVSTPIPTYDGRSFPNIVSGDEWPRSDLLVFSGGFATPPV
jgi:hypothetical protein